MTQENKKSSSNNNQQPTTTTTNDKHRIFISYFTYMFHHPGYLSAGSQYPSQSETPSKYRKCSSA
jgi:hypothetical protein